MDSAGRTFVEVLRHAKACSREIWHSDDVGRPLNDAGWHQAKHLASAFDGLPLTAIYSSPAVRCTQSVEALAGARGLEVVRDERLAGLRTLPVTDGGAAWPAAAWLGARALGLLHDALADRADGRVIICSHGDVLAAFLAAVAGRDGLDLADVSLKKGARATLVFDAAGRCISAERLPPAPSTPPSQAG